MRIGSIALAMALSAVHARGQVFSSEFFSDPVSEGWPLLQQHCGPILWNDSGTYNQRLGFDDCSDTAPPGGGQDAYLANVSEYNGDSTWFFEFRAETDGDRSEISGIAPIAFTAFNFFGSNYSVVLARDRIKLYRDALLPILFFDLEPEVPHTIRLELNNVGVPTYRWYIDHVLVDAGLAEYAFPDHDARVVWLGEAWNLPCENAWDYIRYGRPPTPASGDFDSDGDSDQRDAFYFAECIAERGNGPGAVADPGCLWADMDTDGDIDFADFAQFQQIFTGSKE